MQEYKSIDRKFGVVLGDANLDKMSKLCLRANNNETGGILVGEYKTSLDCAIITDILGPTSDSRSGHTWFERGTKGLQGFLNRYWYSHKRYYVGEWHYHPFAAPEPSGRDLAQMREISASPSYKCPEPIMIIIGGNPKQEMQIRVFVFPNGIMDELELVS